MDVYCVANWVNVKIFVYFMLAVWYGSWGGYLVSTSSIILWYLALIKSRVLNDQKKAEMTMQ